MLKIHSKNNRTTLVFKSKKQKKNLNGQCLKNFHKKIMIMSTFT